MPVVVPVPEFRRTDAPADPRPPHGTFPWHSLIEAAARPVLCAARMTAPRQILAGSTNLTTRRCSQRAFLLTPTKEMHQLFLFLLAVASTRYSVHVHAFCVMSNHFHLVVTDPGARLPAFHQYLDGLLARAMNALLGRSEHFWDSSGYSPVELGTPADVVQRCAYVLANPVAAGLVERGRRWPGPWSAPETIGAGPVVVARPEHFFAEDGALPPTASLELVPPPGFDAATFRHELRRALEACEAAVHETRSTFLGAPRVLGQKPTTRPRDEEPRRTLRPRVASVDATKRAAMLARLKEFWRSYRASWAARRAGKPDVTFPAGTYLLRVAHGVPCAAFG